MNLKADPNQESLIHYTSLQWIVAFGNSFFDAHMDWVKHSDPVFGAGSYGHISSIIPEHFFLMHKEFEQLKDDGWRFFLNLTCTFVL
jgi:hypothetical protein